MNEELFPCWRCGAKAEKKSETLVQCEKCEAFIEDWACTAAWNAEAKHSHDLRQKLNAAEIENRNLKAQINEVYRRL